MAQYDSVFRSMYHLCETIGSGEFKANSTSGRSYSECQCAAE